MAELDDLAQRTVSSFALMLRRGARLVTKVLVLALVGSVVCLLLAAQLDGSGRSLALAFGIVAAAAAVGGAGMARWRLLRVTSSESRLLDEVRQLADDDQQAQRVIIDTVETNEATGDRSVVMWSQQFGNLHQRTISTGRDLRYLRSALRAIMSLPLLLILSFLGIGAVAFLSVIFALAALL